MNRGTFIASSASLVAAAGAPAGAQSVPGGSQLVERRANFDESAFSAAVNRGQIRLLWEQVAFHPQVFANVKNAINGLQFGFGYPAPEITMAMALHGPSSAYNYSDNIWSKYKIGDTFALKDAQGNPVTSNVFLTSAKPMTSSDPDAEDSIYQDASIAGLQKRGVVFLTCHTAVEEQARAIVKKGAAPSGMTATAVADDILTHLIPGTHVVPSMVATIAVLQQRFRYAFIMPDFV
jgi:intracellular sulfur oxidation DsrE/DsrF family protein